jgi:hypothetical protein
MSGSAIRILAALIFIGHGLGHALATFPFVGFKLSKTHSADSRILGKRFGPAATHNLCLVLHTAALISFVAAGAALAGWGFHGRAWEGFALAGSLISFSGLVLFRNAFPFFFPNKVGVIALNALTLLLVLVFRWPTSLFQG